MQSGGCDYLIVFALLQARTNTSAVSVVDVGQGSDCNLINCNKPLHRPLISHSNPEQLDTPAYYDTVPVNLSVCL